MSNENSDTTLHTVNYQEHWDNAYTKTPNEKLGWYENDVSPTLDLMSETSVTEESAILIAGAGSTTLVDELIKKGYTNITATDISQVSLEKLSQRVGQNKFQAIVDDLSRPTLLKDIPSIDLWIDRAVLHFLTQQKDQEAYFSLLKSKVKKGGYALFAEFGMGGATKCCGLPIQQYENAQFQSHLGEKFKLVKTFDHTYFNPNGDSRKYIYSLFIRL